MVEPKAELAELYRQRDELKARLDAIDRDLARGLDRDPEEQVPDLENLDVLQEIERVSRTELRRIVERIHELGGT